MSKDFTPEINDSKENEFSFKENDQKFSSCIAGRVLKKESITNKANAKIRKYYLEQEKEVIINALLNDFQERFNYEEFISEIGLSEVFASWKIINKIKV